MSFQLVPQVWLLDNSLGNYRLYYNNMHGSASQWAVSKYSQKPEEGQLFSSKKKAELFLYSTVKKLIDTGKPSGLVADEKRKVNRKWKKLQS